MTAASFPVIDLHRTGHRIECQRRAAGLSVRELQQYFGFEYPQAIYKWQHGECLPTVDNLLALSRILHVGMEDLLVYEDQEVHFFLREACTICYILMDAIPRGPGGPFFLRETCTICHVLMEVILFQTTGLMQ